MFSVTESKLRHFPILFSVWKSKYAEYLYLWLTHIVPDFVIHLDNCIFQEDSDVFFLYFFLELMILSLKVGEKKPQNSQKEGIFL